MGVGQTGVHTRHLQNCLRVCGLRCYLNSSAVRQMKDSFLHSTELPSRCALVGLSYSDNY